MRQLVMKNGDGLDRVVEVDDTVPIGYGGFGAVFPVPLEPDVVVKKVELSPPQPIGNMRAYIAHIRTTKERLLDIKSEEENRPEPRRFICEYIDEIIQQALSTHWSFDISSGLQIGAVWFLQRKAPGKSLLESFRDEPPLGRERMRIARDVITRMRTLRRADLVHLDCVADNIFVDIENKKTTLIDLDGCGVVRRTSDATRRPADEWEHRPFTLGHLKVIRLPPWYPQVGIEAGPKGGNFLFAERWVVIDTLIRILTWNRISGALSWLEPQTRKRLVDGYTNIRLVLEAARAGGGAPGPDDWFALYTRILAELRAELNPLPPFTGGSGHPPCLEYFATLSQTACLDHKVLGSQNGSPYEIYRQQVR